MFTLGEFFENHDIWGQRSTLRTGIDDFKLEISKTHKFKKIYIKNSRLSIQPRSLKFWSLEESRIFFSASGTELLISGNQTNFSGLNFQMYFFAVILDMIWVKFWPQQLLIQYGKQFLLHYNGILNMIIRVFTWPSKKWYFGKSDEF